MVRRRKLRVSESRSNVYIDYAEREQLHEGEARIIGESISVAEPVEAPDIDRVINSIRALEYFFCDSA